MSKSSTHSMNCIFVCGSSIFWSCAKPQVSIFANQFWTSLFDKMSACIIHDLLSDDICINPILLFFQMYHCCMKYSGIWLTGIEYIDLFPILIEVESFNISYHEFRILLEFQALPNCYIQTSCKSESVTFLPNNHDVYSLLLMGIPLDFQKKLAGGCQWW